MKFQYCKKKKARNGWNPTHMMSELKHKSGNLLDLLWMYTSCFLSVCGYWHRWRAWLSTCLISTNTASREEAAFRTGLKMTSAPSSLWLRRRSERSLSSSIRWAMLRERCQLLFVCCQFLRQPVWERPAACLLCLCSPCSPEVCQCSPTGTWRC